MRFSRLTVAVLLIIAYLLFRSDLSSWVVRSAEQHGIPPWAPSVALLLLLFLIWALQPNSVKFRKKSPVLHTLDLVQLALALLVLIGVLLYDWWRYR